MAQKEVKQWITVNGKHVPIFEGESKADAVIRAMDRDAKKHNDKYADELNERENKRAEKEKNKHDYELKKSLKDKRDKVLGRDKKEKYETLRKEVDDAYDKAVRSAKNEDYREFKRLHDELEKMKTGQKNSSSNTSIDPVSKELKKADMDIGGSKYNAEEQAEAINYMHGYGSLQKARQAIVDGKHSDNDIKKAILYQETEGIKPYAKRKEAYERALKKHGLEDKTTATQKQISKDLDTKEKQIAQNKAEVDKLNGEKKSTAHDNLEKGRKQAATKHETLMGSSYKQAQSNLASMGKGELATIARKLGIPNSLIRSKDADELRASLLAIYKGSHK